MGYVRHAAAELGRFLEAVDAALDEAVTIVVIGGSALALGYGGTATTSDIDTYESPIGALEHAVAVARADTGLAIPIANSGIAQLPEGAKARASRVLPHLSRLEVLVLERHDLAASKLLRGNEHDRQQLRELNGLAALDLTTLTARFEGLLVEYVGDPTEPIWSFRHLVEELWGELAAQDAFDRLRRTSR